MKLESTLTSSIAIAVVELTSTVKSSLSDSMYLQRRQRQTMKSLILLRRSNFA